MKYLYFNVLFIATIIFSSNGYCCKTLNKQFVVDNIDSEINVTLEIKHKIHGQNLVFEIETNLPNYFMGNMTVKDVNGRILGQSNFEVKNGMIRSANFTDHGKAYLPGKYKLELSSPYPHLQKVALVKKKIGKTGKNLKGKHIRREKDDIMDETYSFLDAFYEFEILKTKSVPKNGIIGVWRLNKGNGNYNEYIIKRKQNETFLITKIYSPNLETFVIESKLIKINSKYVKEEEKEHPSYRYEIKNKELIIYDKQIKINC